MKLKFSQLTAGVPVINELLNQKINILTSYRMLMIRDVIQTKIDEQRQKEQTIATSFIKRNDDGSPVFFVDENGKEDRTRYQPTDQAELQKKMMELREEEIDLGIEPIPLSQLKDALIEPAKLPLVAWLIDPNR